jgi:pimeloyl-ACP methyl ester carboxylesterase
VGLKGILMKKLFICILLLGLTSNLFANPKEYYYQNAINQKTEHSNLKNNYADNIFEYHFKQLIDHNNPQLGSFAQRYYIDESYSNSDDSPVFFYICGEAVCNKRALNGLIRNLAKKFNAKMVALEHRYYGKSLPRPNFSAENLQYLTTEFALKDLKSFQDNLIINRNWNGKWISFGGSYPGSLSAYYRLKYPDMLAGALASSAPVMAEENFDRYDAHIADVAGTKCLTNIKAAVYETENALNDPDKFTKIKDMFDASLVTNDIDFLYLIADIAAIAIQYGMHEDFCNKLDTEETPLIGYATYAKHIYNSWGINALSLTAEGAMHEDPKTYEDGLGMRPWFYQVCTEYGYWQNAYYDQARSSRSSLINLDYHKNLCERLFNIKYELDTNKINNEYYLPLFNPGVNNIYFTNGSTDPWSNLSMSDKLGNSTNPNLDFYMIDGAAHCDDLHDNNTHDSMSLKGARIKAEALIHKWLS